MTRDYRQEFVDEINAAARLKVSGYTTEPALKQRIASRIGKRAGRDFATFSAAVDWLFSAEGGYPALPHPPAAATASAARRGRRRDRCGPGHAIALGALTALPGGTAGTEGSAPGLAELDESHEAMLTCALCAGVIEPGTPMTYYADSQGGFCFYHPGCAVVPEALA